MDTFNAVEGQCFIDESHGLHWCTQTPLFALFLFTHTHTHTRPVSLVISAVSKHRLGFCHPLWQAQTQRASSLGRLNVFLFKIWWGKNKKLCSCERLFMWQVNGNHIYLGYVSRSIGAERGASVTRAIISQKGRTCRFSTRSFCLAVAAWDQKWAAAEETRGGITLGVLVEFHFSQW